MTHLLHVNYSFAPGGAQVRIAGLINHLGPAFRHTLVALDGGFGVAERIDRAIAVDCVSVPRHRNPLRSVPLFIDLFRRYDPALILTYNWGSMDAVMAARLRPICPVIHTEDGFGAEEADRQKQRRVLLRRFALSTAASVIAPSRVLQQIMTGIWKLPPVRVTYVPNGVDTRHFVPGPVRSGEDEVVIGSVGHLRPEKRYELLISACAALGRSRPVRLVLAGDGPARPMLERAAASLGVADRVEFLGHRADVREVYRRLDVFAMSSCTEQMPLAVLEAMSCGLPVISTAVGDIREMVSRENRPYICSPCGLPIALARLTADGELRREIGAANRARAISEYSLQRMCAAYESLYCSVLRNAGRQCELAVQ